MGDRVGGEGREADPHRDEPVVDFGRRLQPGRGHVGGGAAGHVRPTGQRLLRIVLDPGGGLERGVDEGDRQVVPIGSTAQHISGFQQPSAGERAGDGHSRRPAPDDHDGGHALLPRVVGRVVNGGRGVGLHAGEEEREHGGIISEPEVARRDRRPCVQREHPPASVAMWVNPERRTSRGGCTATPGTRTACWPSAVPRSVIRARRNPERSICEKPVVALATV